MLRDLGVVQGKYLENILEQPTALQRTLSGLEPCSKLLALSDQLRNKAYGAVILTGMGSSYHVLHPLCIQLIESGITAMMVETSELVHYKSHLFAPTNLVIAVSQSGESAEVVRLLHANQGRSPLIGITNTEASSLARKSDVCVPMRAGEEFSVSCKTYLTSLMVLKWLGDALIGRLLADSKVELAQAIPAVRTYLGNWQEHVLTLLNLMQDTRHLFLVGRGASLAAVGTGALIVKESDRFHAEGMSSAAFRHGPLEMLSPEMFVLVFSGDDKTSELNRRLLDDIAQQRGRAMLVSEQTNFSACELPHSSAAVRPILEILPIQMITLALAAAAGREPGRFEFASKVTTTE
jgi:glucosamine--fructose-6-phosphate aminotransferase (isomerizing)